MQLIRVFGQWPIAPYLALDDEAKAEIWRGDRNKEALVTNIIKQVAQQRIKEDINAFVGKWLAEEVWAKKGYNAESTEKGCKKKWDEELNDWTYQKNADRQQS